MSFERVSDSLRGMSFTAVVEAVTLYRLATTKFRRMGKDD